MLLQDVRTNVPSLDPLTVVAAGANDISGTFSSDVLPGIIKSYAHALRLTFALGVPFAGVAFILTLFQPWFRFDKGQKKENNDGENQVEKS